MGTVRLAEDPELGRELAVKFLQATDRDSAEQFVEEAQITSQLQHPNIVPVYEIGRDASGRPWLAMKRIEGAALSDTIAGWKRSRRGRLQAEDIATVLGLFNKVCDAVAFAHSRGVIHRDIKPANVMVGAFGEVLLVDWGLAKPLDRATDRPVRSARRSAGGDMAIDGDVFGTPAYMPPEQADGRVGDVDERADIFSLGGVLYAMLTLCAPYEGRNTSDTLAKAAQRNLVPPRRRAPGASIPKELQAIVLKAMAAEPDDRYESVADLQADLAAWQSFRRTTAWHPGPIERLVKWTRRHPTMSLVAPLLLIGGLAVIALLSQLDASESGRKLALQQAESDRLQADAEAARRELAEARAATEQERADFAEDRVERLGTQIQQFLEPRALAAIEEFQQLFVAADGEGRTQDEFASTLTAEQVAGFLAAYDSLFQLHAELGTEPTANQYFNRALIRSTSGDRNGAIADYSAALALKPGSAVLWMNLANLHRESGDLSRALSEYEQSLRIRPTSASAHSGLASTLQDLGRSAEAEAEYAEALRLDPEFSFAWYNRGCMRTRQGRLEEALADFNTAIQINPEFTLAYNNRGQVFRMMGRFKDAVADFTCAVEAWPDTTSARISRASVYCSLGRPDLALADCDAALAIDDTLHEAYLNRSQANLALGKGEAALADLDAAIRCNPQYPEARVTRANLYTMLRRFDDAIADCDAVLAIDPRFRGAHVNKGNALVGQGRVDDALAEFAAELEADPHCALALISRGNLRAGQGQMEAALEDFSAAVVADPRSWRAAVNQGVILERLGRRAEAIKAMQHAWRICDDAAGRGRIEGFLRQLGGSIPDGD